MKWNLHTKCENLQFQIDSVFICPAICNQSESEIGQPQKHHDVHINFRGERHILHVFQ